MRLNGRNDSQNMRPWTLIILYTSLHGPVARVSAEILVSLRGEQVENMGRSNFGAYMWDPKVSPAPLTAPHTCWNSTLCKRGQGSGIWGHG